MNYKSALLKQNQKIFKTDDLALLWEITNRDTLLTIIARYLKNQTLFSIRKGLYSVVPIEDLDPYLVGTSYISGFCYVSLQSVLASHMIINQIVDSITLIGNRSKVFTVGKQKYICKKIHDKYLYNNFGINLRDKSYPFATKERAIADTLYYNPNFHFDLDINPYMPKVKFIKEKVFDENTKT